MAFPRRTSVGGDLGAVLARAVADAAARHPNLVIGLLPRERGDLLLPERDLELILAELLANCAEGCGRRPRAPVAVRFGLRRRPGSARLVLGVADSGPGLAAGLTAEEAISPFVTTKERRLGVGLARVDTIAEMYELAWSLASVPQRGTLVSLEVALPAGDVTAGNNERGS
jgi:C4-dicarboxylate-specific signal transduction histidine kinase